MGNQADAPKRLLWGSLASVETYEFSEAISLHTCDEGIFCGLPCGRGRRSAACWASNQSHHMNLNNERVGASELQRTKQVVSSLSLTLSLLIVILLVGCGQSGAALAVDEAAETVGSPSIGQDADLPDQAGSGFQAGDIRELTIPGTGVSFTMVYVPGGTYRVGTPDSEPGRESDEGPITEVSIDGFWMGQFEVTDEEFGVFRYPDRDSDSTAVADAEYDVDAVSRPSPPYEDPAFGMGGEGKPAVGMTQWAGLHYAKWLTEKTGVFFRLPSEAEWEVACRAGQDPSSMALPDERALQSMAWYDANSDLTLQAVGDKRPNDWQLYDMLGNAAEWMLDEYVDDYHSQIASLGENPWIQPTRLHPRTVRGGDYGELESGIRCGSRLESTTDWKRRDPQIPKSFWWNTDSPFVGFRIMAPETPPSSEEQEMFWMLVLGE